MIGTFKTAHLVAGCVAFVSLLVAYVVLAIAGEDTSGLIQLILMVGGLLGLGAHNEHRTQQVAQFVDRIDHQTNGALTKRIHDGAAAALRTVLIERDGPTEPTL